MMLAVRISVVLCLFLSLLPIAQSATHASLPKDAYERCKSTHRCSQGWTTYNQSTSHSSSTMQTFASGQHKDIPLFADFEDWRQGTQGWKRSSGCSSSNDSTAAEGAAPKCNYALAPPGAHWSPFHFAALGSQVPSHNTTSNKQLVLNNASASEYRLLFNTSSLEMVGKINATGVIAKTPDGTEVALWAFESIDIDENVKVTLIGQRAMALVSRSSVRINSALKARPGTLGGFPGGYSVSRRRDGRLESVCGELTDFTKLVGDRCAGDQAITTLYTGTITHGAISNNVNGPGSGSIRVYLKTIETTAPIENRVQTITVNANQGQTLAGSFNLHFNGYSTPFIPHDATAEEVKTAIEESLNPASLETMDTIDRASGTLRQGVGDVTVEREAIGSSGGNVWTVTYTSAVGKHPLNLTATNALGGKGANVFIQTLSEGNAIGGHFSLSFLGDTTRPIPHDVSSEGLQQILLNDISRLENASVLRSNPTHNKCNAGFCTNGPSRSGGYDVWTLSLTTQVGNSSPFSPTSQEFDIEGELANMTAINNLTGCVELTCPEVLIADGHGKSHVRAMQNLFATQPFSLAYGGSGASHGGKGGEGFTSNSAGQSYGDKYVTNLYGGSGGALGLAQPFEIIMFDSPRARGGGGGGAIEIVAANDISLGPQAVLSCDGQEGFASFVTGGGGGSGGTVLLSAGGAIHHEGVISVKGGSGGRASQPNGRQDLSDGHGGGGGGGRVAMYAESIVLGPESETNEGGGNCPTNGIDNISISSRKRLCDGEDGTIHLESRLDNGMHVDYSKGAAGTSSSLRLRSRTGLVKRPYNRTPAAQGGPEYDFRESRRPGRISLFVQIAAGKEAAQEPTTSVVKDWGAFLELRSRPSSKGDDGSEPSSTAFIGVHIGRDMKHGANTQALPYDDTYLHTMSTFLPQTVANRWYKIDVRLHWMKRTYDIILDDNLVVREAPFVAEAMDTIAIANYDSSMDMWLDEIFVGDDTTMGFRCPFAVGPGEVSIERPSRRGWKTAEIGGMSYRHDMQRHESHISRRALYNRHENAVIVPYDGSGHNAFTSDVKFRDDANMADSSDGKILAGSLLQVQGDNTKIEYLPSISIEDSFHHHGQPPHTYIWYGEHSNTVQERDGYVSGSSEYFRGGVAACSTRDFVSWKNEGIMLHYTNVTDMVSQNNDTMNTDVKSIGPYYVERPKVLYNNSTGKYVMWMTIDNGARELAMAGVAVSEHPTGPFDFVRSFYPDGNQTRDQTLVQDVDGTAYLVRSYYATVEFVLPSAVMQPTWESVKDANGEVDFAASYHRAHYEPDYDDYHDIYLQRWRTEDRHWQVVCVERNTGVEREVAFGKENLNYDGEVCNDPFEYKKVLGQGNPTQMNTKDGISSHFVDPNDPANNAWRPDSVPGVKAQPWSANYRDGTCGIRQVDDGKDILDPTLPDRDKPDRGSCSNIADNPTHRTVQDKLIGKERIVESRRTKFIAISRLTDDYLDTSGLLTSFEGELEEGTDLIALLARATTSSDSMPFGWSMNQHKQSNTDSDIIRSSTYTPQVRSPHFQRALQ